MIALNRLAHKLSRTQINLPHHFAQAMAVEHSSKLNVAAGIKSSKLRLLDPSTEEHRHQTSVQSLGTGDLPTMDGAVRITALKQCLRHRRAQSVPEPQPAVTPLARPLGPSETGLSSRLAPALRSVLDRLAEPNLDPTATPQQRTQPSAAATANLSDVPPPKPRPSAATQPLSGESVIRQQQARYAPRPGVNNQRIVQQGTIVRGQGGPAQRRQPVIGSGGRIIGNGRVINSFRRIFGR